MFTLVVILHVVVALALILIVLLQTGKGASMGAAFGGGSSGTVFGTRGPAGFMSKLTAGVAILFMITSLGMTVFRGESVVGDSVMDSVSVPAREESAPAEQTAPEPAPEAPVTRDQAEPIDSGAE